MRTSDHIQLTKRASFASHRLIGWIYWDPQAIANYEALGIPNGMGYYIATRAAPMMGAGNQAVTAAFGSIAPSFVEISLDLCRNHTTPQLAAGARDAAIKAGLEQYAPEIIGGLATMAPMLWDGVDRLPGMGRPLFAAHREWQRPSGDDAIDKALSAWLAINCIREWRGDTHWAIQVAEGLSMIAAGVLDGAWREYDGDWLPKSRGADDDAIWAAKNELEARGFVTDGQVNAEGVAYRQSLEDRLDAITATAWETVGWNVTEALCVLVEPIGDRFMERVDQTAGPKWMPAGRKLR